jgi:hypothetical protein
MELLIKLGGIYNLGLVVFHLLFWRIFNWGEDLRKLSFLNRAIMQVLNLSLTFVFVIFAWLSLAHSAGLLASPLGHGLLVLMALFWFLRALQQPLFFGLRHWGSVAFLLIFLTGAALYGVPAFHVLTV